jgi:UDP-xylose/UDP-N-acetylglucosamine transporter B4
MFFVSSLLNNAALGYDVSIPVFIIIRSGGTFITMIMSYLLRGKKYTNRQIGAVALLTTGVALATWRSPQKVVPFYLHSSYYYFVFLWLKGGLIVERWRRV